MTIGVIVLAICVLAGIEVCHKEVWLNMKNFLLYILAVALCYGLMSVVAWACGTCQVANY